MNRYLVMVDPGGRELTVVADSERQAHKQAWNMLTDGEKNSAASLEVVEVTPLS